MARAQCHGPALRSRNGKTRATGPWRMKHLQYSAILECLLPRFTPKILQQPGFTTAIPAACRRIAPDPGFAAQRQANHAFTWSGNCKPLDQPRGKPASPCVLIPDISNLLWTDEGFGVRCVEAIADTHALPPDVRLLDGGTQGLSLLPFLEDTDTLLVFDAIDYGQPPSTLKVVENDAVPAFTGAKHLTGAKKMSLHQTGFQVVIATAALMGYRPARMVLIGRQPVELDDCGGRLRPAIAARISEALRLARDILARWGVTVTEDRTESDLLADPAIRHAAYEQGRPCADEARRTGDAHFFPAATA